MQIPTHPSVASVCKKTEESCSVVEDWLPRPGSNMRSYHLVILSVGLVVFVEGSTRVKREEEDKCEKVKAEHSKCVTKAYDDYRKAATQNDGKPDFMARKACNYMTAAVEECGNKLVGDCYTEDKVNAMKDEQVDKVLDKLQQNIKEWESDKCPAVKQHIDRKKAAHAEPEDPKTEPEAEAEPATGGDTGSATAIAGAVTSLSLVLVTQAF